MSARWSRPMAIALVVVGLVALMFGPGRGAIAVSPATQGFASRILGARFSGSEVNQLETLRCLEEAVSAIPDDASVLILPIADDYVMQRLVEIAYPRLRLVDRGGDYRIYVDPEASVSSPIVADTTCGAKQLVVTRG